MGSLAYSITANTSNFTAGVVGTKAELRDLKNAFLAGQPPVEKFSTAISHLEGLAAQFPAKAAGINRTIAGMRTEMSQAAFKATAFGKAWSAITPTVDVGNLALRGGHAALRLFRSGLDSVIDRVSELRDLNKKAGGMGMSLSDLVGLSEAAESLSSVGADELPGKLGKFGAGIGTAAMTGKGPAADATKRLGLDAGALSAMGVKDQLLTVADALQKVENVNERMALSKGLLGKGGEELAPMLAAGGDAIRKIADEAERTAGLKFVDQVALDEAWNAMDQLGDTFKGVLNVAASEFAPLIRDISDDMSGMLGPGEELRNTIAGIANATRGWLDGVKMVGENPIWKWLADHSEIVQSFKVMSQGNAYGVDKFVDYEAIARRQQAAAGMGGGAGITANVDQKAIDKASKAEDDLNLWAWKEFNDIQDSIADKAQKAQDKLIKDKWDALQDWADMEAKTYKHNDDKATKIIDAQKNGAEKLRDDMKELIDLRDKGFLSPSQFTEGLQDLRSKARDMSMTDTGPRSVTAMRGGSVEALRQEFSGKNNTEKQLEEAKKTAENTREAAELLIEIKAALIGGQTVEAT